MLDQQKHWRGKEAEDIRGKYIRFLPHNSDNRHLFILFFPLDKFLDHYNPSPGLDFFRKAYYFQFIILETVYFSKKGHMD